MRRPDTISRRLLARMTESLLRAALGVLCVGAAPAQPHVPALPSVVAVQCNIDRGGRYSGPAAGPVTWETARRFAGVMAGRARNAAIVGMQEVDSDDAAAHVRDFLAAATRGPWTYIWTPQGKRDKGDGLAIFYRTDRLSLERDLGKTPIDYLDDGTILRFMGGWFRLVSSGKTFGFFTGKLVSRQQDRGAHPATEGTQRQEAWRVREWIRTAMLPYPDDARIVAIDLESPFGSAAWFELHQDFQADSDKRFTYSSHDALFMGHRFDYLWWDGHRGQRDPIGFIGHAGRSEHFGGAHRFVWAEMKL